MTGNVEIETVAGESLSDLMPALVGIGRHCTLHDRLTFDVDLPDEVCMPFVRALMRIEAEILLHDADLVATDRCLFRTAEQRRAAAFTELIKRVATLQLPRSA